MLEWLIGILLAYWWVYKRKPKSNKLQDQEPAGSTNDNGIPFGYLKRDESMGDLI